MIYCFARKQVVQTLFSTILFINLLVRSKVSSLRCMVGKLNTPFSLLFFLFFFLFILPFSFWLFVCVLNPSNIDCYFISLVLHKLLLLASPKGKWIPFFSWNNKEFGHFYMKNFAMVSSEERHSHWYEEACQSMWQWAFL